MFNFGAGGQGQEPHQVEQELAFILTLTATLQAGEGEAGIAQASGLNKIGFGDAQVGEIRLQPTVIEDSNLDRTVYVERLGQQAFHLVGDARRILIGLDALRIQTLALTGDRRHLIQAAVRAE